MSWRKSRKTLSKSYLPGRIDAFARSQLRPHARLPGWYESFVVSFAFLPGKRAVDGNEPITGYSFCPAMPQKTCPPGLLPIDSAEAKKMGVITLDAIDNERYISRVELILEGPTRWRVELILRMKGRLPKQALSRKPLRVFMIMSVVTTSSINHLPNSMPPETERPLLDPLSLSIITFPHPGLRYVAKSIRRVDANLKLVAARMLELMYEHRGVGLAATQVNLPLRLFVMNATGEKGEGEEYVVINPVLSRPRGNEEEQEGCLSLPNIHGKVIRAKTIHLNAFDLKGNELNIDLTGFDARVVQHETDHLDGVIFLDRMKEGAMLEDVAEFEALCLEYQSRQRTGEIPPDEALLEDLIAWESRYC